MSSLSDYLPVAAIGISLLSLSVSGYVAFRDRARLKIKSRFIEASEYGPSRIIVTMVNAGRRPIILRLIGGQAGKRWAATYLDHGEGGKRLGEHESYEHTFGKDDLLHIYPDDEFLFEALWVEDSLGVRHPIPKSREHIKQLLA